MWVIRTEKVLCRFYPKNLLIFIQNFLHLRENETVCRCLWMRENLPAIQVACALAVLGELFRLFSSPIQCVLTKSHLDIYVFDCMWCDRLTLICVFKRLCNNFFSYTWLVFEALSYIKCDLDAWHMETIRLELKFTHRLKCHVKVWLWKICFSRREKKTLTFGPKKITEN